MEIQRRLDVERIRNNHMGYGIPRTFLARGGEVTLGCWSDRVPKDTRHRKEHHIHQRIRFAHTLPSSDNLR
jgi:hypothetical protein